jgi:hypothetical protein
MVCPVRDKDAASDSPVFRPGDGCRICHGGEGAGQVIEDDQVVFVQFVQGGGKSEVAAGGLEPLGPLVFLFLAVCSRKLRRSDASDGSAFPPPEGLSANTRPNCRGPVFLNSSLPLLNRLSPASSLLRRNLTSARTSSCRRCLLQVYRSRGPLQISLGKNTGYPAPAPITVPASVGFWASRSKTR